MEVHSNSACDAYIDTEFNQSKLALVWVVLDNLVLVVIQPINFREVFWGEVQNFSLAQYRLRSETITKFEAAKTKSEQTKVAGSSG